MTRSTHQTGAFAAALGALVLLAPAATGQAGLDTPLRQVADALGILPSPGGVPWPIAPLFFAAALLGGLAPDADKPTHLWAKVVAGAVLGGHRHLSHSLIGLAAAAGLTRLALVPIMQATSAPIGLLWVGFVVGYASHLVLDSLTTEGVPWLYPKHSYFGFPPAPRLRIRTGSLIEQLVVTPTLLAAVAWLGFARGAVLAGLWGA